MLLDCSDILPRITSITLRLESSNYSVLLHARYMEDCERVLYSTSRSLKSFFEPGDQATKGELRFSR